MQAVEKLVADVSCTESEQLGQVGFKKLMSQMKEDENKKQHLIKKNNLLKQIKAAATSRMEYSDPSKVQSFKSFLALIDSN